MKQSQHHENGANVECQTNTKSRIGDALHAYVYQLQCVWFMCGYIVVRCM